MMMTMVMMIINAMRYRISLFAELSDNFVFFRNGWCVAVIARNHRKVNKDWKRYETTETMSVNKSS